jgi:hypothetical protein
MVNRLSILTTVFVVFLLITVAVVLGYLIGQVLRGIFHGL